MPEINTLI